MTSPIERHMQTMRNMSFSMTTPQFRDGSKDITRRFGWLNLKPGELLMAVEKAMGLKKGEKIVPLGIIQIVSTRLEPVRAMADNLEYGLDELRREGYPFGIRYPSLFVEVICNHYKKSPDDHINRIEFRRIPVVDLTNMGRMKIHPWQREFLRALEAKENRDGVVDQYVSTGHGHAMQVQR